AGAGRGRGHHPGRRPRRPHPRHRHHRRRFPRRSAQGRLNMTPTTPTAAAGSLRELISFRIGAQEFCVDIMSIRETRGWTAATALPPSPTFVRGVINLGGAVLPIVDLAARLGFETGETSDRNVIIVAQI